MTRVCPVCKRPCNDYNADYCGVCGTDLPDPKFAMRDKDSRSFRSRDGSENYDNYNDY